MRAARHGRRGAGALGRGRGSQIFHFCCYANFYEGEQVLRGRFIDFLGESPNYGSLQQAEQAANCTTRMFSKQHLGKSDLANAAPIWPTL